MLLGWHDMTIAKRRGELNKLSLGQFSRIPSWFLQRMPYRACLVLGWQADNMSLLKLASQPTRSNALSLQCGPIMAKQTFPSSYLS
jgi:hypothetical protein